MRRFTLAFVGVAVIVGGAIASVPILMFAGFVVAAVGLALAATMKLRDGSFDEIEQGLSPTLRSELAPIRAYRRKLTEWVAAHPEDTVAKVIGAESIISAAKLHQAAADAQRLRRKLLATNVSGARERADDAAKLVMTSQDLIANLYNELVMGTDSGSAEDALRERLSEIDALQKSVDEVREMSGA